VAARGVSVLLGVLEWFADPANWRGETGVPRLLVQHLGLTAASMGLACLVALPVALWLGHVGRGGVLAVQVGNTGRAVPTLAVLVILVLMPPPLGRSTLSALVAFTLFAVPPILTNTYVGMREVDRGAVDAARGMGMTGLQVLRRVELPLAAPLLMNGVRVAAVQVVATVSIAAIAAFGGLGRIITRATGDTGGLDLSQLIAGALVIAALAVAVDGLLALAGRAADPVARARRVRRRDTIVTPSASPRGRHG
jgi:osmoprotectant transport system permease protein